MYCLAFVRLLVASDMIVQLPAGGILKGIAIQCEPSTLESI